MWLQFPYPMILETLDQDKILLLHLADLWVPLPAKLERSILSSFPANGSGNPSAVLESTL